MSRASNKPVHYHKYERMTWPGGKIFYKCMEPNCPHYLPTANLVIGRESLCWGYLCNKLVLITKEDIAKGVKHPMCSNCKEKRIAIREELKTI
jgi:hypothetical protein